MNIAMRTREPIRYWLELIDSLVVNYVQIGINCLYKKLVLIYVWLGLSCVNVYMF